MTEDGRDVKGMLTLQERRRRETCESVGQIKILEPEYIIGSELPCL
jgi:hypothetical protein